MNDVLPADAALWERFEDTARAVFAQYGYRNIRVPLVETTPLFVARIGEYTDIVEKEMYTFEDKLNGEQLTLRPEATAGIVRAAIEHNLIYDRPQRVWTTRPDVPPRAAAEGPLPPVPPVRRRGAGLRRPGRRRRADRHARAAVEDASACPASELQINSIGNATNGARIATTLVAYFEQHADALDEDAKRRLHTNPLRILDSKNPAMQAMIAGAPKLARLPRRRVARAFRRRCRSCSTDAGIAFDDQSAPGARPRLLQPHGVRVGRRDQLGAQGTVCGGGRYDGLFEQLGGKPTPASGFAIGVERLILLLAAAGDSRDAAPLAYVVHDGDAAGLLARRVAERLRDAGLAVVVNAGGGSFKAQMKRADAAARATR